MYPAVNAWTFPHAHTVEDQLQAAAAAGFAGFELVVGDQDPLRPDTPTRQFVALRGVAADLGLRICGVATGLFWQYNYASPAPEDRSRAHDLTLRMLDQAAAAEAAAILVVPAVVGQAADRQARVSYADAMSRVVQALSELRHEAAARGVTIAIENVWNRFLLSPLEAAELIDEVNSPHVGFYLDTGNVLAFGYPEDWIATLKGRIARVHVKDYDLDRPGFDGFCPLGAGDVNWPAVIYELKACGYDGPLTFEGEGDPADISRRLKSIIAGSEADQLEDQS